MGDQNFIKFISSIAYYFGISTVVLYANYLPCNYKIIQHAGAKQRNYSKEINNDNINIKINNINDIDNIYDTAIHAGATGGKILGAGGGGFILFFVRPELQTKVKESLNNLLHVPFRFENTGSQIIFYEPDLLYGK